MAAYHTILVDRPEDGVAVLTLNRPDSLNVITWEMVEELHDCYWAFEADTDTSVVILTGAGRAFCSGTDLTAGGDHLEKGKLPGVSGMMRRQRRIADLSIHMRKIPQPIVAAVHGVAAGGGFSFAMACDVRVADESARFICSFINIGLSSGDVGSSYWLQRLVGFSRAAELLYSGRSLEPAEAKEMGLLSRVVLDGGAMDAALETARIMLAQGPSALRMTKELLNYSFDAPSLEAALYMENRTQSLALLKDVFTEGSQVLKEKRPPKFPKENV